MLVSDLCHFRGTSVVPPVQHIEPSCMGGVVNVTEVSMGWWDIPLEGHPMDTTDAIFLMAATMLELLSLVAALL